VPTSPEGCAADGLNPVTLGTLDEVFIRIQGVLHYPWRAVDQHGVVLDILVQDRNVSTTLRQLFG
jgi:transposase-like protein